MTSICRTIAPWGMCALLLASAVHADCVYKDVMSADEIAACRDAPSDPGRDRKPGADAQKSAVYREVERQMARDTEARRPKIEDAKRSRVPVVGMSAAEARQLPYPWGSPSMINKSSNADGAHEQWVFPGRKYLYFQDGVLTLIEP